MILGNGDKALLWTERLRVLEQVFCPLSLPVSFFFLFFLSLFSDKGGFWTERLRALEQVSFPLSLSLSFSLFLSLPLSFSDKALF